MAPSRPGFRCRVALQAAPSPRADAAWIVTDRAHLEAAIRAASQRMTNSPAVGYRQRDNTPFAPAVRGTALRRCARLRAGERWPADSWANDVARRPLSCATPSGEAMLLALHGHHCGGTPQHARDQAVRCLIRGEPDGCRTAAGVQGRHPCCRRLARLRSIPRWPRNRDEFAATALRLRARPVDAPIRSL